MRKIGLISWLARKLGGSVPLSDDRYEALFSEYMSEIHVREVALWSVINIISNAVSKCEFKTYLNGKEVKKEEYYLWNVEPNKNQNSSAFIHKWLAKLLYENECLIIEQNGQLLVADSFNQKEYALYENVFTEVTVGDFVFSKAFHQSDVLYFKLSEKNMRQVTDALYNSYIKLVSHSMKAYLKSRGTKGIFSIDTMPKPDTDDRKLFDDLITNKFKGFMEKSDAIITLGNGQKYEEIGSKTYASESTRDIRALIDDVSDFTAKAFGIPPALLRGDIQGVDSAVEQLLTFCIDPLVDMLQEEINRKRIGKTEYLKGTKIVIDTKTIKHIDLFSITAAVDKLVASGCFSVNDIRKAMGEEPIDEEWANRYFMTKNYSSVEEIIKAMEGSEKNEAGNTKV